MEQKQIETGNILIAEFMGGKLVEGYMYDIEYPNKMAPTPHSSYVWNKGLLQYHGSWDWLMPVVEKINDKGGYRIIETETDSNGICAASPHSGQYYYYHPFPDFVEERKKMIALAEKYGEKYKNHLHIVDSKIAAVWHAVIAFIHWHNQQSSVTTLTPPPTE